MLVSEAFCEKNLQLLFTVLDKSSDATVRANTIIAAGKKIEISIQLSIKFNLHNLYICPKLRFPMYISLLFRWFVVQISKYSWALDT